MEDYVLGVDLGTGSMKFIIMDEIGKIVEEVSTDYPLYHPDKGYAEQKPMDWINAFKNNIELLKAKNSNFLQNIKGLSISGQMHSLVLLDKDDCVIRDAILWNDVRTTKQCKEIESKVSRLLEITKNKALEGFTLPKILWVKENEPINYQKISSFLLPKDYITFWLTGTKSMDYSDAAGTLMLDINKKVWSDEILNEFAINKNICPKLVESGELIGDISPLIKEELGLTSNIKVFAGGADNACGAIGAGISNPSRALASIGTSGVFLSYEEDASNDYKGLLHYFNHAVPNSYYSMGVTLAAGSSLDWFMENFAQSVKYEEISDLIKTSTVGSNNLLFTPYISGERSPHFDSQIRGSFIGLDIRHQKADLLRSVIEGITFSLRDSMEIINSYGKDIREIVSVGGAAKNDAWLQIQADIFNRDVYILESAQGPGIGACYIAATGIGWFDSVECCMDQFVKYGKTYSPIKENVDKYNEVYKRYTKVYECTKKVIS